MASSNCSEIIKKGNQKRNHGSQLFSLSETRKLGDFGERALTMNRIPHFNSPERFEIVMPFRRAT
jgi:hypothetical protein